MYTEPNGNINSTGKYLYDIAYYISPICEMLEISIEPNIEMIKNNTTHIDNDIHNMAHFLDSLFYMTEEGETITSTTSTNALYYIENGSLHYSGNPFIIKSTAFKTYPTNNTIDAAISPFFNKSDVTIEAGNTFILHYTLLNNGIFTLNTNTDKLHGTCTIAGFDSYNIPASGSANNYSYNFIQNVPFVVSVNDNNTELLVAYDIPANITNILNSQYICIVLNDSTKPSFNIGTYTTGDYITAPFTVEQIITEPTKKSYFELWRELYASDDLIQAKEAQKPQEEKALEEFTGNGEASASVSDITSAANTSKQLKQGLNTGVSASHVFEIFNTNSSIFSWFTNTTKENLSDQYLYTIETTRPLLRGTQEENRFYNDNLRDYQSYIGGNYND